MIYLYVVIGVIVAAILAMLTALVIRIRRDQTRNKEYEEIRRRADDRGVMFYWNINNNIIGICQAIHLDEEKEKYLCGETHRKKWEKIELLVVPTYIFYKEPTYQNLITAGSDIDFHCLLDEITEKAIGIKVTETNKHGFVKARETIIKRQPQLFVPFSSNEPKPKEQEKIYLNDDNSILQTLENVRKNMLGSFMPYDEWNELY